MLTEEIILDLMRELEYKPMNLAELEAHFKVTGNEDVSLASLLDMMEEQGKVVRTRSDAYGVPEKMHLVVGRLQGKAKGFGFVIPEDPTKWEKDLFVSAHDMNGAMHGDRVIARISKKGREGARIEGEIIRILERGTKTVVGTVMTATDRYAFVSPDDKRLGADIFVPAEDFNGAKEAHKVVVEIVSYSEGWRNAQGRVLEVLGYADDPGVDILAVIRKFGLPEEFPEEVLEAANDIPDNINERDLVGRRDLRDWMMCTIDGEDAKDLDDAVNVMKLENGNYLLGVHIADVSYYVREGSPLDQEAYERGTSVYLVDRVIPMIPHRLSNGICSLNPQVDRLSMTCEMEFSPSLELVRHDIYPSVIKTNERMTYGNVYKILTEQPPELMERYKELVPMFRDMEELAMKLRQRRFDRGAIDFEFQETKVIVGEDGKVAEIKKRERTIAEMIIEEFMLAANEVVSEHFHWLNIPFLYRIHEEPAAERIQQFNEFIHNFGFHLKGAGGGGKIHPRALQEVLAKVKGEQEERIVNTVLLRSLKQAKYSPEPAGHFGLAAEFYSHFTSPIRRYPDLQIHRIMREVIENGNKLPQERLDRLAANLPVVAQHTSERERVAVEAERETDDVKKVEFMLDKVGEVFDGIVSGVTSFGMFVELDNSIEGMIHLSYMTDDYYNFNEKQYCLIGERTGRIYRIGDRVRVKCMGANKLDRTIDFQMMRNTQNGDEPLGDNVRPRDPRKPKRQMVGGRKPEGAGGGRKGGNGGAGGGQGGQGGAKKKKGRSPKELSELKQAIAKSSPNKKRKKKNAH